MTTEETAREYLRNLLIAKWDKKEAEAKLVLAERLESTAKKELLSWMKERGLRKIAVNGWYLEPCSSYELVTMKQLDSLEDEVVMEET